jgi:hypothetical protein
MNMNRRAFLGTLAVVAVAPVKALAPTRPALMFHRDAFALVMKPLPVGHMAFHQELPPHFKTMVRDAAKALADRIDQQIAAQLYPGMTFTLNGNVHQITEDVTADGRIQT